MRLFAHRFRRFFSIFYGFLASLGIGSVFVVPISTDAYVITGVSSLVVLPSKRCLLYAVELLPLPFRTAMAAFPGAP